MEEPKKEEYISLILASSQVILAKMVEDVDKNGYYLIRFPMKPLLIEDSSKIILVPMNPFSNSVDFRLHSMHIMSIGLMDVTYIDLYDTAVNNLIQKTKQKYNKMANIEEEDDEFDDEFLYAKNISKTVH